MDRIWIYLVIIISLFKVSLFSEIEKSVQTNPGANSDYLTQARQNGNSCITAECHSSLMTNEMVHSPAVDDCSFCHASKCENHPRTGSKTFVLEAKVPELCYNCHDGINSSKKLHSPVEEGDCLVCHNVHSSSVPSLLVESRQKVCFTCHDMEDALTKSATIHGPITDKKACLNCHSPHGSDISNNLIKEEKELCLGCHNKTLRKGERTIKNIKQLIEKSSMVHPAIEDGCTGCHYPHTSDFSALLKKSFPADNYDIAEPKSFALCFECHEKEIILDSISKKVTSFRNKDRNLHYLHVKGKKGRSCILCHNVHASVNEHLINEKSLFGDWEMPMEYKVTENGGSCANGCHKEKVYER